MLEIIPTEQDNIVAYRVKGKITKDAFDRVADRIEAKLNKDVPELSIYAEIDSLSGIEPSALLEDIKFGARHMSDLKRLKRVAVVTEQGWIEKAAAVEGALLPGVSVQTFEPGDEEQAMSWAIG